MTACFARTQNLQALANKLGDLERDADEHTCVYFAVPPAKAQAAGPLMNFTNNSRFRTGSCWKH